MVQNITIFTGKSHPKLAEAIAKRLGVPVAPCKTAKFSNMESNIEVGISVRDMDVYIVQSGCGNVNDNFIELLIMISACKFASARKVTAVLPCFPYARQPESPFKRPYIAHGVHSHSLSHIALDEGSALACDSSPSVRKGTALGGRGADASGQILSYSPPVLASSSRQGTPQLKTPSVSPRSGSKVTFSSNMPQMVKIKSNESSTSSIVASVDSLAEEMSNVEVSGVGTLLGKTGVPLSSSAVGHKRRQSTLIAEREVAVVTQLGGVAGHPTASSKAFVQNECHRGISYNLSNSVLVQPDGLDSDERNPLDLASGAQHGYKHWTARSGTLVANLLQCAGADHIITLDLHDPQFQGFFDIPVDNLRSQPILIKYIRDNIPDWRDAVIVSPDAGGAKRATVIADKLGMEFALVHKERNLSGMRQPKRYSSDLTSGEHGSLESMSSNELMMLVGVVKGKVCILIDDIADTSYTITRAARLLVDKGAVKVVALITHGILSGDSLERIMDSNIDEVIVSNSVPQEAHVLKCPKVKVVDIAPLFGEAIRRIHNGESVSYLFDVVPI